MSRTVAEAYLELLAARGVSYLFGNAGTDFAPLIEALAKGRSGNARMPRPVLVPHENVAVGMAYGYTMLTGEPQAVMVHVGLGTANAICGLFNAYRSNIPMLFTAGRTPWTEGGGPHGGRNNYIHWAQEMFDQGSMVRELMKWDFELRHAAQLETAVDRALALTNSEPKGPVYLALPREVLASEGPAELRPSTTLATASPPHPDPQTLAEVARLLGKARHPLLITADAGRSTAGWEALSAFAERLAVPVVQYRPRYMALPSKHPMHCGYDPAALLKTADLVLVLDCDVPWIPGQAAPRPEAKVVHLGTDPLYARYPLRGFRADLTVTGDTAAILNGLAAQAQPHNADGRRAEVQSYRATLKRMGDTPPKAMTLPWLAHCIDRVREPDTIVVNEYPLALEELSIERPLTYFANSPAGGLGWGLGAALGAKLARPQSTVIAAVGDGAYMFGNPTPFHFVAQAEQLPILTVINNNRRWGAVHRATLALYPQGHAAHEETPPLATLEPSPNYEKIVEASGGYGERVEDPAELPCALERALHAVRIEKRQAVLNVLTEITYARGG
jgi:acetolactate synthase I/II/III large subunit